ncbi:condensation domain-containing protein [Streptomyces sp. NRRL S-495]|uniref:condensation domain-containing protein n=1 Tax=Streptomyces sp. NRRL S-495 TaxID=1609133 RepID=UPI00133185B7|nr:condensation domain-containing protein [Streptomyces sp. NRRL S-495]
MSLVVRSGPLTEQQERWWLRLYWREKGDIDNAWSKQWDLPAGISVEAATAALTVLVERHEVLRTAFGLGPDNLPYQLVFEAEGFRLPLTVAELGTLAEYGEEGGIHPLVGGSLYTRPLWSVRLFVEDDEVRVLSLVFEHIVLDGSGVRNLREQFLALCAGTGTEKPLRITHPLDRAAKERRIPRTPESRARYSRDPRALAPRLLVPATVKEETPDPRFLMSAVRYEGLLPLLDRVCRAHGVSRAMVLMHAVGWLISRYSGIPRIMVVNAIGLRLPSDDSIDLVAKALEIMVDLDEERTLAESLTEVSAGALRAYTEELRLGIRDQDSRLRLEKERGIGSVRGLYFNYQGLSEPDTPETDGIPVAEVRLTRTDEWRSGEEPWSYATWIYVDDAAVAVDFDVDAVMLPAGIVHHMSELLPRFVRLVAEQPDVPLAAARALLPPDFARSTEARLVRGTWVHLDTVAEVVAGCPGVLAAEVSEEDEEIVARVSLDGPSCLFDVHEYVLSRLHLEGDLIAPHRYRLAEGSASRATGPGLPDLAAGADWLPGDGTPVLGPTTEPERELVAALQETHGFGTVNLALTYAEAGGRAVLAPAVVETLRRRGLEGLQLPHFATAHTLRAMARALVRRTPGHAL